MTHLLDINVLIALFDPAHIFHEAAHRWLQTLDLYLTGLAMRSGGRLAMFDASIPVQALVNPRPDLVALVPTV